MAEELPDLGDLEREVMQLVWAQGPTTAEQVRAALSRPLKESRCARCCAGSRTRAMSSTP